MHIQAYTKHRWWQCTIHRFDGWMFLRKPDFIVRLGWITFGYGRYKQTNEECYQLDEHFKVWEVRFGKEK